MARDGREYEQFVARLQQAIIRSEHIAINKNIIVETDKRMVDACGVERQFDIYWEYDLGGLSYKTVIECKDHDSKISVDKIDALIGKMRDLPGIRPVFATKMGYQSGAKAKAIHNNIDLLIVREQNESDWAAPEGKVRLRKLILETVMMSPARILSFKPFLDLEWTKNNTSIDVSRPMRVSFNTEKSIIDDLSRGKRYSLLQLADSLVSVGEKTYGVFRKHEKFKNAFICFDNNRWKLVEYELRYEIRGPTRERHEIDFTTMLLGVVEYLQRGTKKSVFRDGTVHDRS